MEKASSPKCRNKTPPVVHQKSTDNTQECQLCYMKYDLPDDMYTMLTCKHTACRICLESYLTIEITESRTDIACPQCSEPMHPSDIQLLLKTHPNVISKYEDFMVRRVLLADPDSRWCPAPDCSYAVIASDVLHVRDYAANDQAVICNSVIIVRLNGIRIRHAMRLELRDTVQRGRRQAVAVKIHSIVSSPIRFQSSPIIPFFLFFRRRYQAMSQMSSINSQNR